MKTKKKLNIVLMILIVVLLVAVFVFAGIACSSVVDVPGSGGAESGDGGNLDVPGSSVQEHGISVPNRVVIYTGELTVLVYRADLSDAVRFITLSISPLERGEWFESQQVDYQGGRATLVARVLSSHVYTFIDRIVDEFSFENTTVTLRSDDVSLSYANRQREIDIFNEELDRLFAHLEANLDAPFHVREDIQRQINTAQTRLFQLQTQQNIVSQQVQFSTITINIRTRDYTPTPPPSNTRRVFQNVWNVIRAILTVMLYILAAIAPLAVIAFPTFFFIRYLVRRNKRIKREQLMAYMGMQGQSMQNPYPKQFGQPSQSIAKEQAEPTTEDRINE